MNTMVRRGVAPLVAASALVLGAGLGLPAANAGSSHAQKLRLTQTNRGCDGAVIDTPQKATFGFVNLIQPAHRKFVAVVVLKGAQPNTTYTVRLIQVVPGGGDCLDIDGTVTTNQYGNGNTTVHEAKLSGATAVWVDLNNKANFAQFYTTAPIAL